MTEEEYRRLSYDPDYFARTCYPTLNESVYSMVANIVGFGGKVFSMGAEDAEVNRMSAYVFLAWYIIHHRQKTVVVSGPDDESIKTMFAELVGMVRRALIKMGTMSPPRTFKGSETYIGLDNGSELYAIAARSLPNFHHNIGMLLLDDINKVAKNDKEWLSEKLPEVMYLVSIHGLTLLPSNDREDWEGSYHKYVDSLNDFNRPGKSELNVVVNEIDKCDAELIKIFDLRMRLTDKLNDVIYRFGLEETNLNSNNRFKPTAYVDTDFIGRIFEFLNKEVRRRNDERDQS